MCYHKIVGVRFGRSEIDISLKGETEPPSCLLEYRDVTGYAINSNNSNSAIMVDIYKQTLMPLC